MRNRCEASGPRTPVDILCQLIFAIAVAVFSAAGSISQAVELEATDCKVLANEKKTLQRGGVESQIDRGPAWASQNLDEAAVERIRRYISLEEQIKFRCPPGFQNAVVASIRSPNSAPPPLPIRAPRSIASLPLGNTPKPDTATARPGRVETGIPLPDRNRWRQPTATPPQSQSVPLPVQRSSKGDLPTRLTERAGGRI